jgi:release factor glutamine methyltransferase
VTRGPLAHVPLTAAEAIAWGRSQLPAEHSRDAELLLRVATDWDKAFLLAHPETPLNSAAEAEYRAAIARRATGEPVQYIAGSQEFWGLQFHVTPAVLIPRPETEHLVEAVLAKVARDASVRIADIGTGSGAIAIALATELPQARLLATDISDAALQVARGNAEKHGVADRVQFVCCNLLPDGTEGEFDVVASNPPYVAEADRDSLAREVKDFEPSSALFAGPDGLTIYRRLIPVAYQALKPGGWLALEMGAGQRTALDAVLTDWKQVECFRDLQGIERVLVAQRG